MAYWILKTEPSEFSWDDLVRDGSTTWNGVTNPQALIHLRSMQIDDLAMIYHTGGERAAVGIAQITTTAYPDPNVDNPKIVVVDIVPVRKLAQPVTLAQIKAQVLFAESALVKQGRLSVVPCSIEQWMWLLAQSDPQNEQKLL